MTKINNISVLSEEELRAIETEVSHLPDRKSAAIEALRIVQESRGWVSDQTLSAIADQLGMSAAELDSIATFYNLIHRQPVGRHVIMMCDSVSCYVMGCEKVHKSICAHLNVQPGETTEDDRFTVLPIVCLGACDKAPVVMIDDQLIENISAEAIPDLLEEYV
tara:strand:+ start:947 stop:1435 length:489 start_codon:yes stop_codon:yes gene_type:complete